MNLQYQPHSSLNPLTLLDKNGTEANISSIKEITHHDKGSNHYVSKEAFLARASIKYGNKFRFNLDSYTGLTGNKIKIYCDIHGLFEKTPQVFLLKNCKTGCAKCGFVKRNKTKTRSYDDFLKKASSKYKNKYVYLDTNRSTYVNRKSKVLIECKDHGLFTKTAQKHLLGQACWGCKVAHLVSSNILVGGYCDELFKRNPKLKNTKAVLYYLSINGGKYYKIGVTKNLTSRIRNLKSKSKSFIKTLDVVWIVTDTLFNCYTKEQEILSRYKKDRSYFKWSTEVFSSNILPLKLEQIL